MTNGCRTNFKVVQPAVTDRNRSYYQSLNCSTIDATNCMIAKSIARPVAPLVSQRSWATEDTTMHDWSHGHVRPVCDLLRFVFAGTEFWTWSSTLLQPNLPAQSPTTSKINHAFCQRFICDSSYFWSYTGRYMVASPVWLGINKHMIIKQCHNIVIHLIKYWTKIPLCFIRGHVKSSHTVLSTVFFQAMCSPITFIVYTWITCNILRWLYTFSLRLHNLWKQ